jgi:polar amino acid transport system substrate-binding protein
MKKYVVFLALIFGIFFEATSLYAATPVRVGIKEIPPFVYKDSSGVFSGFSIDLLTALEKKGVISVIQKKEYGNVKDLIVAAEKNEADFSIAAITINETREKQVDFSQPMFNSGLTILLKTGETKNFSILTQFKEVFTSHWFSVFIIFAVIFTFFLSVLMYFIERRKRDGFLDTTSSVKGITEAYWWGITALTGQQQNNPATPVGRILAVGWMYFGVIFISFFTAQITSNLTAQKVFGTINSIEDLSNKKVATIENSTSATYLQSKDISISTVKNIEGALGLLDAHAVDAVVYGAPTLQYLAKNDSRYETVGGIFKKEDYGIAFPEGSPLKEKIDRALLEMKENGEYQKLMDVWFTQ